MVLIWIQLFKQIKTFICELLKENVVIQLIIDLKMHCSPSNHDQRTKHTHTNTHLALIQLFRLDNVGSFRGLANDTFIVLYCCFMVMRCHQCQWHCLWQYYGEPYTFKPSLSSILLDDSTTTFGIPTLSSFQYLYIFGGV